jgi:hypothetical protein
MSENEQQEIGDINFAQSLIKLSLESLKPMEGSTIEITSLTNNQSFKAQIDEVVIGKTEGKRWESFVIYLDVCSKQDIVLTQGYYRVNFNELGIYDLFSSPNSETELEFCFNFDKKLRAEERAMIVA